MIDLELSMTDGVVHFIANNVNRKIVIQYFIIGY